MEHWEIIADNPSKAGWSWSCVSAIDSHGRTIWIADAHRDDGQRFVVRADDQLTAFIELERAAKKNAAEFSEPISAASLSRALLQKRAAPTPSCLCQKLVASADPGEVQDVRCTSYWH
jgi:hypothetical protein